MRLSRRALLGLGVGAAAAVAARRMRTRAPQRVLVLGGTSFVGPAIVEELLARGHVVTLFNRGKTNPSLFPGVERILGDREADPDGLAALRGARAWDAVIDVWPSEPAIVEPTATLLAARTSYYFFISSISAYAKFLVPGQDETAPTRLDRPGYGGDKARSEQLLAKLVSPERLGVARPHAILGRRAAAGGPGYLYWLSRLATDGEVLAPGDGTDVVQYVDVTDLGRWVADSIDSRRAGVFNVCAEPLSWRAFLEGSRAAVDGKARLVWVADDFLLAHGVRTFVELPSWNPDRPGFARLSTAKARAAGWSTRPLVETARDSWRSYRDSPLATTTFPAVEGDTAWGISLERERGLIAEWRAKG